MSTTDSRGTDFWLGFGQNFTGSTVGLSLTLYISSETATSGTVAAPGLAFSTPFTTLVGIVTAISIPVGAQITSTDTVGTLGVHVTALADVSVYAVNKQASTTAGFLVLPTELLGTDYYLLSYPNDSSSGANSSTGFYLVGVAASTTVTITPKVTTNGHAAATPYTVSLNAGSTYQIKHAVTNEDLSGSHITADKAVAVFGSHSCAEIPQDFEAANVIAAQMPPSTVWGDTFVIAPLKTRLGGDTYRVLSKTAGTVVTFNGVAVATLGVGQVYEQNFGDDPFAVLPGTSRYITATHPVLVGQFSNGTGADGSAADPGMLIIPPTGDYFNSYTVTALAGFTSYVNVVVPTVSTGAVLLDGAPTGAVFTAISTSGYSSAFLPVTAGSHTLSCPALFGVIVYGFATDDFYGYSAGVEFSPVDNTIYDTVLLSQIQAHLIETVNGGQTVSSGLWTVAELTEALDQAQLWLIREAMPLLDDNEVSVLGGTQRITLPADWLITKRVAWASGSTVKELPRDSAWDATQGRMNWETVTATSPSAYTDYETPQLSLELLPPPTGAGEVRIMYVPRPPVLGNGGEAISLPDACAPTIKWRAVAILLAKEGRGQDMERAQMAQQFAEEGKMALIAMMQGWA